MIHQADEDTLRRWLGPTPPMYLLEECTLRTRMLHSAGHSGPVGLIGLMDMVRAAGLSPSYAAEPAAALDWRDTAANTPVEAFYRGSWVAVEFIGFVEAGQVAIRVPGDQILREVPVKHLRPVTEAAAVIAPQAAAAACWVETDDGDVVDGEVLDSDGDESIVRVKGVPRVVPASKVTLTGGAA